MEITHNQSAPLDLTTKSKRKLLILDKEAILLAKTLMHLRDINFAKEKEPETIIYTYSKEEVIAAEALLLLSKGSKK